MYTNDRKNSVGIESLATRINLKTDEQKNKQQHNRNSINRTRKQDFPSKNRDSRINRKKDRSRGTAGSRYGANTT